MDGQKPLERKTHKDDVLESLVEATQTPLRRSGVIHVASRLAIKIQIPESRGLVYQYRS